MELFTVLHWNTTAISVVLTICCWSFSGSGTAHAIFVYLLINEWSNTTQEDNKTYRKHKNSEGKWQPVLWSVCWGQPKSDQNCTQANMLAVFPLTTARDRRWWNHCHSLGSPDIQVNNFVCEATQKRGGGLTIHSSGFDCDWLKVVTVKKVIIFSAICNLNRCLLGWHCLCSGTEQMCPQLLRPIPGLIHYTTNEPRTQNQSIRPPYVPCQAEGG